MKKLILAIFCISIINISFSQNEKADAEFLKILKEYTLNPDGSIDFHYSKELKLLSHYSFHRLYGETFITYNTDFQTLKINSAYTIMADGKKIVTPENAFNKVLPRFSTDAPTYNNIREMVVTHTGLEVGATIYLDYTITNKAGYYPELMSNDILQESSPVKELIIKVNVPENKTLNFELLNIDGEHLVLTEKDKVVYSWTFHSLAASSKDYYQEKDHLSSPRLIFSTAKDLKKAYDFFVNQSAFEFTTNEAMDKVVADIVGKNSDQLVVALELQKLVCNDLKTINVPLQFSGFKCRTAIDTWKSNKGTYLEKAILLNTLLRKANIKTDIVVVIPNTYYNDQIGNILGFNNFLVRLNLDNYGEVYLSVNHTDNQNLVFGLGDKTVLLLDKNIESLKKFSFEPKMSKVFAMGEFEIHNSDSLNANMQLVLEANANPYFNIFNDSSKIKSVVRGGISSKDITTVKIDQLTQEASSSHLEMSKSQPFKNLNTYLSFELPYVSNGVGSWHINLLTAERNSTLEIPELIHERYDFMISYPDDLKLVTTAKNIEIKNNAGFVLISFEILDNGIKITKEIKFEKKTFDLSTYGDFKEIMNVWNNDNYNKVIFKKN